MMNKSIALLVLTAPLLGGGLLASTPVIQSQPVRVSSAVNDDALGMIFERVQQQDDEIRRLNGQVEELTFIVERLREENRQRYIELDERLSAIITGQSAVDAVESDSSSSASISAVENAEQLVEGSPQERYDRARSLLLQRQLPEAIFAFNEFIKDFPEHRLAANAYYWLAETYALLPDLPAAENAFRDVLRLFPDDPKAPDALFKLGVLAEQQGDSSLARDYFSDVIALFPESQAARLAERRL